VFFDTLYVFLFPLFFNLLFSELQFMRIKMYIYAHARYALLLKEEANVLGAVCVEAFLACGRFDR